MIINLTQHQASPEQVEAGVVTLEGREQDWLSGVLTFTGLPDWHDVWDQAELLASAAAQHLKKQKVNDLDDRMAMIGGAPYLMGALESELWKLSIQPVFAFSERVSTEEVGDDGAMIKRAIFKHLGFVAPQQPPLLPSPNHLIRKK